MNYENFTKFIFCKPYILCRFEVPIRGPITCFIDMITLFFDELCVRHPSVRILFLKITPFVTLDICILIILDPDLKFIKTEMNNNLLSSPLLLKPIMVDFKTIEFINTSEREKSFDETVKIAFFFLEGGNCIKLSLENKNDFNCLPHCVIYLNYIPEIVKKSIRLNLSKPEVVFSKFLNTPESTCGPKLADFGIRKKTKTFDMLNFNKRYMMFVFPRQPTQLLMKHVRLTRITFKKNKTTGFLALVEIVANKTLNFKTRPRGCVMLNTERPNMISASFATLDTALKMGKVFIRSVNEDSTIERITELVFVRKDLFKKYFYVNPNKWDFYRQYTKSLYNTFSTHDVRTYFIKNFTRIYKNEHCRSRQFLIKENHFRLKTKTRPEPFVIVNEKAHVLSNIAYHKPNIEIEVRCRGAIVTESTFIKKTTHVVSDTVYSVETIKRLGDELKAIDRLYMRSADGINNESTVDLNMILQNYYEICDDTQCALWIIEAAETFSGITGKRFSTIIDLYTKYFGFLRINYDNLTIIKTDKQLFFILLAHFILKILLQLNYRIDDEKDRFNSSDNLINAISYELYNLLLWLEILFKEKLDFDNKNIRYIFFYCFISLTEKNKVKEKHLWRHNKTLRFYTLKDKFDKTVFSINLSFAGFKLYSRTYSETYLYNYHFSTMYKIFKENYSSGYVFKTNLNSRLIDNLNSNWVYVSTARLKIIFQDLISFHKITIKSREDLKNRLIFLQKNLLLAIKENDDKTVSSISRLISVSQHLFKLNEILNLQLEGVKLFLPYLFGWRGRLYFLSDISLTHYKDFRYCSHQGVYEELKTKHHFLCDDIKSVLKKSHYLIDNWPAYNFSSQISEVKDGILWILVSIAETNKTKLPNPVPFEIFVKEGIRIIDTGDIANDIDKIHKVKYLKNVLDEINTNVYKKWLIPKDATASGYQHLVKSLGCRTPEALKWCNLDSPDHWYDTYSYIIKSFKKNIKLKHLNDDEFDLLFTRTTLKRTMMTENYGAQRPTCWKYFNETFDIDTYTLEKQSEIASIFKSFHTYLSSNNELLAKDTKEIVSVFKKQKTPSAVLFDNSTVNYGYFKKTTRQVEIHTPAKRYTLQEQYVANGPYVQKTWTALRANYIHSLDASLVRWYIEQEGGITIHDCFMVDWLNITYAVAKLNEGMRIVFHDSEFGSNVNCDKIFSMFIVL